MSSNPTDSLSPIRPLRIIYVDDMKELRDLITIVLSKEGYVIETMADGHLALAQLERGDDACCDLLITDHHMPEMNGLELVRELRRRAYPGKILVFSSEISHDVRDKYRQLAVDGILPKPIFPAQLRQALREMFAGTAPASA